MQSKADVHPHFDREDRSDPISGHTLKETEGYPWVQEGDPDNGITIYFESEANAREYAAIPTEHPEQNMSHSLSNDIDEGIDEG